MSEATRKQSASSRADSQGSRQDEQGRESGRERGGPKLAEWFSLAVSALVILGLAGYLVYQGLKTSPPYVATHAALLMDQVRREEGRYILPVEVHNAGRRTIRDLTVEVSAASGQDDLTREITIDYLAEKSRQKTYVYYDQDPRTLDLQATAQSYRLE